MTHTPSQSCLFSFYAIPTYFLVLTRMCMRASVGLARVISHVSAYNAAALLAREHLKNTLLGFTVPPTAQAMSLRLIDIFTFPLEQFFLTRDFPIFSSSSSSFFFFIFFLSHRPSALRKRGKGLIFTPNISTGDGGGIVTKRLFLFCSTTQRQITVPSTSNH